MKTKHFHIGPVLAITVDSAVEGMRSLADNGLSLKRSGVTTLDETFGRIRNLYARAHDWEPPTAAPRVEEHSTPLRACIRRWITEWDLRRLHPQAKVELETSEWQTNYSEGSRAGAAGREIPSNRSLIDSVLGDIA